MDLNKEDGGNRKYICVQMPEQCDEKSEAYKAGYATIADIAKERIRRAGKKIQEERSVIKKETKQTVLGLDLGENSLGWAKIETGETTFEELEMNTSKLDLGFKVLKLEDSNFKQWQQIKGKDAKALEEQMKLFVDPVAETATTSGEAAAGHRGRAGKGDE